MLIQNYSNLVFTGARKRKESGLKQKKIHLENERKARNYADEVLRLKFYDSMHVFCFWTNKNMPLAKMNRHINMLNPEDKKHVFLNTLERIDTDYSSAKDNPGKAIKADYQANLQAARLYYRKHPNVEEIIPTTLVEINGNDIGKTTQGHNPIENLKIQTHMDNVIKKLFHTESGNKAKMDAIEALRQCFVCSVYAKQHNWDKNMPYSTLKKTIMALPAEEKNKVICDAASIIPKCYFGSAHDKLQSIFVKSLITSKKAIK